MNNIAKFLFFVSSYTPLLLIMCINSNASIYNLSQGNIDISLVVVSINIFLIFVSIMFLIWVLQDRRVTSRKIDIVKVENKTSETLSYILPYIVAFYQVDFSNINNLLIFLIMFITIFAVYVNSNLIAINPLLAILGYKIFVVEAKREQKIFVISKRDILLSDREIRAKPICCNIYLKKEIQVVINLQEKLNENSLDNVNLYYILRTKTREQTTYKVSGIKIDQNISKFFKGNIQEALKSKLEQNDNSLEYIEYEPDIKIERNIVLKIAKTEVDLVAEYLEKLEDLENMNDSKQLKQKNLWGYIVHFNDINLYMFKKFTSANVSLKSKGFMNALIQDGVLNSVENDLITFDRNVDCLLYEDEFLIFHKQNFEKVFDFFEKMYQIVEDKIGDLAEKGFIKETDELFQHCKSDSRKIKRLKSILESDLLNSIDKTKFNDINEQFELGLEFDEDGNIQVEEEKTWQILALLNDDYLNSDLTMANYEAQGKIKK